MLKHPEGSQLRTKVFKSKGAVGVDEALFAARVSPLESSAHRSLVGGPAHTHGLLRRAPQGSSHIACASPRISGS